MTTWVHVINNEHVTVINGQKVSVFEAPYRVRHRWEVRGDIDGEPIGFESTEVAAKYRALRWLRDEGKPAESQTRGDVLDAHSAAIGILYEAFEIGNISEDELAENLVRIHESMIDVLIPGAWT